MPLKSSSSKRERERVRSFSFNRSAFYTQLFHTTKSTLNLILRVFLSPPQTTKKKEKEHHVVAKSCEYCRRLHVEEMRFVFVFFFWSEKTQQ